MSLDPVALLEGLVSHYSPTGSEGEAGGFLVRQMNACGFDASVDAAGNAVGTLGSGPHQIMLLGHIDTVPGEIPVQREGDILRGRGSVDAKGPLACFTSAAAGLQPDAKWKVTVIGAAAEEGDSHGCKYLLDRYTPDLVIIGEPSGWERITLGYKGSAWLHYQVEKPTAHTASRHSSAPETAVDFWNRLKGMAADRNRPFERNFEQLTPSLRRMGSENGEFSDRATLEIGLRLPPGLSVEQAYELCNTLAEEGTLELLGGMPAYRSEKNSPLVRALLASIRASGGHPGFVLKTGTSDMNLAGPAWGCPMVAYGPGDSELDHTPNEHIHVSEYLAAVEVLSAALRRLTCGDREENAFAGEAA